jgi:chromosomal replication initiation ATPase DnaA
MKNEYLTRDLRRAYIRYGYTLFLDAAEEIERLQTLVNPEEKIPVIVDIGLIQKVIENEFDLPLGGVYSNARTAITPKRIAMYLAHTIGSLNKNMIAREFKKNHSTVIHSLNVIVDSMAMNEKLRDLVREIGDKCLEQAKTERKNKVEKMKCLSNQPTM